MRLNLVLLTALSGLSAVVDAQGFFPTCWVSMLKPDGHTLYGACNGNWFAAGVPMQDIQVRKKGSLDLNRCFGLKKGRLARTNK